MKLEDFSDKVKINIIKDSIVIIRVPTYHDVDQLIDLLKKTEIDFKSYGVHVLVLTNMAELTVIPKINHEITS